MKLATLLRGAVKVGRHAAAAAPIARQVGNALLLVPELCPRLGKWIRGCHFEPAYDTTAAVLPPSLGDGLFTPAEILEKFRARTFVCLYCTSCGKTREARRG